MPQIWLKNGTNLKWQIKCCKVTYKKLFTYITLFQFVYHLFIDYVPVLWGIVFFFFYLFHFKSLEKDKEIK